MFDFDENFTLCKIKQISKTYLKMAALMCIRIYRIVKEEKVKLVVGVINATVSSIVHLIHEHFTFGLSQEKTWSGSRL